MLFPVSQMSALIHAGKACWEAQYLPCVSVVTQSILLVHYSFLALQALQSGDPACVGGLAAWRAQAALLAQDRAWGAALQAASDGLAFAEHHQGLGGQDDTAELRLLAALAMLHQGQADRAMADRAIAGLSALAGTRHLQLRKHSRRVLQSPVSEHGSLKQCVLSCMHVTPGRIQAQRCLMASRHAGSQSVHASTPRARALRMRALCGLARGALLRSDQAAAAAYYQDALAVHSPDAGDDGDTLSEQAAQGLARAAYGWLLFEQGQSEVRAMQAQ